MDVSTFLHIHNTDVPYHSSLQTHSLVHPFTYALIHTLTFNPEWRTLVRAGGLFGQGHISIVIVPLVSDKGCLYSQIE